MSGISEPVDGAVRQIGGLISRQDKREPQTIGEFFNKTADTVDTAVNFFPLSAGFSKADKKYDKKLCVVGIYN